MGIKCRAIILAIGLVVEYVVSYAVEYVFYPFVVWKLGLVRGGVIMAAVSLMVCYSAILFYDRTKRDWFGIELAKKLRDYEGKRKALRLMAWALKRGQFVSFLFLSLKFDPFTTTVYLRGGSDKFSGMDANSWKIFFASWFIGNLSWLIVVFAGVSAVEFFWRILH